MPVKSTSIDVCYIITNGFAARMVTQTNLLGLLVKEGKKVAVICSDINDQNLKSYCDSNGVKLYNYNPISSFWTSQYSELRKYFLEDIDSNVALKEKHIWATRFNTYKNPYNHLRPQLAYLGYKLTKAFPIIRQWYKSREEKHLKSKEATTLIEKINPKVLVSTYPVNFSEATLLKAGNDRSNTKTVIHLLSWDNITCKGKFPQLSDEYIVWGPVMKNEFLEYYKIKPEFIHMCGVPHFDLHYDTKQKLESKNELNALGLNPELPYIFFGMSSPRFAPKEIDIVEWIACEVEKDTFGTNIQFVVRPHPQNVNGYLADLNWLPRLEKIKSKRVGVDFPILKSSNLLWSIDKEDMVKLSQIISGSSITINSGSTISIDALCHLKPVLITSFDANDHLDYWKSARRLIDYPHLKKLNYTRAIQTTKNFTDLVEKIKYYLENPNVEKETYQKTVDQYCYLDDGKATERVCKTLLKWI